MNENVTITFCSLENSEDIMTIKISVKDAWKITKFCNSELSYASQLQKKNPVIKINIRQ